MLPESLRTARYDVLKKDRFILPGLFMLEDEVSIVLPRHLPPASLHLDHGFGKNESADIMISDNSRITISPGFIWNGASGPTADNDTIRRAACIHDALYAMLRAGSLEQKWKGAADRCLRKLMKMGGINIVRRNVYYWSVRLGGGHAASERQS